VRYLETAFGQLAFAIKLMQAAEDGLIDLETIDRPLAIDENASIWVLPNRTLESPSDLVLACQNIVTTAFGAAAITLNRCREEAGAHVPDTINTDCEQWIALVYQIRNAFAHDIADPRWHILSPRYARTYEVGSVKADLRGLHGLRFSYEHIGGAQSLFALKAYGCDRAFGRLC